MRRTSFKFYVEGDTYEELVAKAEATLNRFLNPMSGEDFEEDFSSSTRVTYEMVVQSQGRQEMQLKFSSDPEDISNDYEFYADVFAKIQDK